MRISYEKAMYLLNQNREYIKCGIYGAGYVVNPYNVEKYTFESFWNELEESEFKFEFNNPELKVVAKLAFEASRATFNSIDELLDYKPKI